MSESGTADSLGTKGTFSSRMATLVSYVVNPIVLPPLTYLAMLPHFGAPARETVQIVLVCLLFLTILPLAYVVLLVFKGQVGSVEIRDQAKRRGPLLATMAISVVGIVIIGTLSWTQTNFVMASLVFYVVNGLLATLITLELKISLHVIGIAGTLSTLFFVAVHPWSNIPTPPLLTPGLILALSPLIPLVMWARVRSRAHSVREVVTGAAFGLVVPFFELWAFMQMQ